MNKYDFSNVGKVTKGALSVIAGVLLYCLVVAPMLKSGAYFDVARESLVTIGLGFIAAVAVVYALCVLVITRKGR